MMKRKMEKKLNFRATHQEELLLGLVTMTNDVVRTADESAALLAAYRLLLEAARRRREEHVVDSIAGAGATTVEATGRPVEEGPIEESSSSGRPIQELYRQGVR